MDKILRDVDASIEFDCIYLMIHIDEIHEEKVIKRHFRTWINANGEVVGYGGRNSGNFHETFNITNDIGEFIGGGNETWTVEQFLEILSNDRLWETIINYSKSVLKFIV